jgi:hypothetical protein
VPSITATTSRRKTAPQTTNQATTCVGTWTYGAINHCNNQPQENCMANHQPGTALLAWEPEYTVNHHNNQWQENLTANQALQPTTI